MSLDCKEHLSVQGFSKVWFNVGPKGAPMRQVVRRWGVGHIQNTVTRWIFSGTRVFPRLLTNNYLYKYEYPRVEMPTLILDVS